MKLHNYPKRVFTGFLHLFDVVKFYQEVCLFSQKQIIAESILD